MPHLLEPIKDYSMNLNVELELTPMKHSKLAPRSYHQMLAASSYSLSLTKISLYRPSCSTLESKIRLKYF
jgi:hypothetical protein